MSRAQRRQAERKLAGFTEYEFNLREFLASGNLPTRHHEAWGLLEQFYEKVIKANRLHRKIWRLLRGKEWEVNPFALWRLHVQEVKAKLEAEAQDGAEGESGIVSG